MNDHSTCGGEPPKLGPLPKWNPQEKWVWERVSAGEMANFNQTQGYGGELDPKTMEGWTANRQLRQEFLEAILLKEPYRSAVTRKGVCIEGAWFNEHLDLMLATVICNLFLNRCRFDHAVYMAGLKASGLVSFQGSKFNDKVDLSSAQIENDLFMRNGAEFTEVELIGTDVGGHLDMSGSKFNDKLNMNGLKVGGTLCMRDGAEFAEVDVIGAQVVGEVDMAGSRFNGVLSMNSLKARRLIISNSILEKAVLLDSSRVESHLFIRSAIFSGSAQIILNFAVIGANLDLSGSTLTGVSLIGANIRGSLVLGQRHQHNQTTFPARWQTGAKLTLNDTSVGALQDLESAWPNDVDLEGFRYRRLGGLGPDSTTNMAMRDVAWLKGWLSKQKRYSPSPYEQLASVLVNAGQREKANEILYASRERERKETSLRWRTRLWLTLQRMFIGYGYRVHYSLYWVLGFVVLGVVVLQIAYRVPARLLDDIFYSIDLLLPIIDLDKRFSEITLNGWAKYYFYVHKMMGYVLASFIIAGLSGLTKHRK